MRLPWTHLSEGKLIAFRDGQTMQAESRQIEAHLADCAACRTKQAEIAARSARVEARFQTIQPPTEKLSSTRAARAHLEPIIRQKENETMFQKILTRKYRAAWITAGVLMIFAVLMTIPQVRAIAVDFLGLFRVEQVKFVEVSTENLPQQFGESVTFQDMFQNSVQVETNGDSVEVGTAGELSQKVGFTVRLPDAIEAEPTFVYEPGGTLTLKIDVEQVRLILAEGGRTDVQIPDEIDGKDVVVTIPGAAIAKYGVCEYDPEVSRAAGYDPDDETAPAAPQCTTFMQLPSPTIETQPGLDIDQIGDAYLRLLGMSPAEAKQFAESIDWTTTLVVPMPVNEAAYEPVTVDGVEGTLLTSRRSEVHQYVLLWVKDGILNLLSGPGDAATALELAESLR